MKMSIIILKFENINLIKGNLRKHGVDFKIDNFFPNDCLLKHSVNSEAPLTLFFNLIDSIVLIITFSLIKKKKKKEQNKSHPLIS